MKDHKRRRDKTNEADRTGKEIAPRPRQPRKAATLKDVAREAGVSIAAASYALNSSGSISDELRARVRQVAKRLGYRPNRSAQSVRTGRNMTLGLLLPDLRDPYFPALAQSIEHAARRVGYTVMLIDASGSMDDEVKGMHYLEDQGVAGAIWCQASNRPVEQKVSFDMPVVVIGAADIACDSVTVNEYQGGRELARHLIEMGHRRIGVLSGDTMLDGKDLRRKGFMDEIKGKAEIVWQQRAPYSIDPGEEIAETLDRREVTAVMCGNDLIAIGVLRAARGRGLSVPDDLSVVGFDDIPWASIVSPALTTVNQPVAEMAEQAIALFLDRLALPERPNRHVGLDVRLVVRESVARLDKS